MLGFKTSHGAETALNCIAVDTGRVPKMVSNM